MTRIVRISRLVTLLALAQACASDNGTLGPASKASTTGAEALGQFSAWSSPVNLGPVVNSAFNEQHPSLSRDGLSLYFVSNRPSGGFGLNDIWVTQRSRPDAPWGPPHNLGPAINTSSNDFAPDLTIDGHRLYLNSDRPHGCGGSDLYVARRRDQQDDFGWSPAENLGCAVNTVYDEAGPTFFEDATGIQSLLFTSLNRPGGLGDFDIYLSTRTGDDEVFGPAVDVTELNGPFRDTRTAISADGLELFESSDVTGRIGGIGSQDLWTSTRATTADPWSTPVNLGATVNDVTFDGAPALSFDGTELYFFSLRPGGQGAFDLYVSTRARLGS